jgi:hypothetical protein
MPQFYNPFARVTFFSPVLQMLGHEIIPAFMPEHLLPLLRRSRNDIYRLPGDGIVHISTTTGERHTHGETQDVSREQGMQRVVAENVRPQRPLDCDDYNTFSQDIRNAPMAFFERRVSVSQSELQKTNLDPDSITIVKSYLFAGQMEP